MIRDERSKISKLCLQLFNDIHIACIIKNITPLITLNPENASDEEVQTYSTREAARAVVVDSGGNIALLHVSLKNYYKLPGGGLEGDEDILVALARECKEEIGCAIEVVGEVGTVIEYRKIFGIKQISYCYFAHVKGDKGEPEFTESELEGGFEIVWVSYGKALTLMAESVVSDEEGGRYIIPRDIALLKAVEGYFVK